MRKSLDSHCMILATMVVISTDVRLLMVANQPQQIDIDKARTIWAEYQRTHDLSSKLGQAVGIDPDTGRVWFGASASDILEQLKKTGEVKPLLYTRVGTDIIIGKAALYDYYHRKGGRR